jgi:hypothetical protein
MLVQETNHVNVTCMGVALQQLVVTNCIAYTSWENVETCPPFNTIVVSCLSMHPLKYAFFGKKFRVQDLLIEDVMNRHLA